MTSHACPQKKPSWKNAINKSNAVSETIENSPLVQRALQLVGGKKGDVRSFKNGPRMSLEIFPYVGPPWKALSGKVRFSSDR